MNQLKAILLFSFVLSVFISFATTWNEPWQDKVIKESQSFVFAKVTSYDEEKGVTIKIIKTLGGTELKGKIEITGFYSLRLCSTSGGHGPEFHFKGVEESYFFIKKDDSGRYCIATPTSGFDYLKDGNVYATYRHSYHQALVPQEIYERTMTAIFNNYHNLPYNKEYISEFVTTYLSLKPAQVGGVENYTFFAQHVALECIYHLRLTGYYDKIVPFLVDISNFHNQVSGARALIAYNTESSKQELMKVIRDTTRKRFVQVICLWTLTEFKPVELKEQLIKIGETASTKDAGFGGNIMDPRVCTRFPSVNEAINQLVSTL